MNQDRGTYKNGGFFHLFTHSCLGRLIIAVIIIIVIAVIAMLSVPSKEKMLSETSDAIAKCIEDNKLAKSDGTDDLVRNVACIFTDCDSATAERNMEMFYKYNHIEVYSHSLYSTARVHSNYRLQGKRVSIGLFGIVIPTVNYGDIVLDNGVIRKDYNQKISIDTEYININAADPNSPDYGNTYNSYEGDGSR